MKKKPGTVENQRRRAGRNWGKRAKRPRGCARVRARYYAGAAAGSGAAGSVVAGIVCRIRGDGLVGSRCGISQRNEVRDRGGEQGVHGGRGCLIVRWQGVRIYAEGDFRIRVAHAGRDGREIHMLRQENAGVDVAQVVEGDAIISVHRNGCERSSGRASIFPRSPVLR